MLLVMLRLTYSCSKEMLGRANVLAIIISMQISTKLLPLVLLVFPSPSSLSARRQARDPVMAGSRGNWSCLPELDSGENPGIPL